MRQKAIINSRNDKMCIRNVITFITYLLSKQCLHNHKNINIIINQNVCYNYIRRMEKESRREKVRI